MKKEDGASYSRAERQQQRQLKRGKRREDRRKYGINKKRRAENKAEAAVKRKALAQAAIVGGDARAGQDQSRTDGTFQYTMDNGASMKPKIKSNKNISMAVPAKKIKKIEDGSSMYGKKHGGSMSHGKKDGMSMYGKKHGGSMYGKKHGASMYGKKHLAGSSMDGEKYDAKQAYNKKLTASARLHYLENERHDKTHAHPILKHMKKF